MNLAGDLFHRCVVRRAVIGSARIEFANALGRVAVINVRGVRRIDEDKIRNVIGQRELAGICPNDVGSLGVRRDIEAVRGV